MAMKTIDARLLSVVESIYDAAPEPTNWPDTLTKIVSFFDDVGAILQWRKDDGSFGTIVTESLSKAQQDYADGGWSLRDIKAIRAVERGYFFNGIPFCDRHVCSEEELRLDPFCTTFLPEHGLGWFGAIAVSPDPHIGVLLSLQRNSKTKPQYSDTELNILADLGRHIEKSLRLSIRLLEMKATAHGLADAFARMDIGVFALDSAGVVVFSNSSGQRLVGDVIDVERGQLRIRQETARKVFEAEINRTVVSSVGVAEMSRPIITKSLLSDRCYTMYLLPIVNAGHMAEAFLSRARIILLTIEQKIGEPPDPALVRDLLGLTLGEARVAAFVGSGLSPKEAAERLGIAHETARNVLKRVFQKVGVSRQSELAALLSKITLS